MGLDILCDEPGCPVSLFHGAYASFFYFRKAVCASLGVPYDPPTATPAYDADVKARHPSLYVLISHSDCDGIWTPDECKVLLPFFKDVRGRLDPNDRPVSPPIWSQDFGGYISVRSYRPESSWVDFADRLIAGLQHCVDKGRGAVFA